MAAAFGVRGLRKGAGAARASAAVAKAGAGAGKTSGAATRSTMPGARVTKLFDIQGRSSGTATEHLFFNGRHAQGPYHPQTMRDLLQSRYPGSTITSSTLPAFGAPGTLYSGRKHPASQVVYDQRGLPDFTPHMTYETQIAQGDFIGKTRRSHMRQATRQLREDIQAGRVNEDKFSIQQLSDIKSGKAKIDMHTWHHNERAGRMQLVKEKPHKDTPHVGSVGLGKNKKGGNQ